MGVVLVTTEVHIVDHRPGLWCETCALPSAQEVDLALVVQSTLRRIGGATRWICLDCGRDAITRTDALADVDLQAAFDDAVNVESGPPFGPVRALAEAGLLERISDAVRTMGMCGERDGATCVCVLRHSDGPHRCACGRYWMTPPGPRRADGPRS